jgi:hypothetical protein
MPHEHATICTENGTLVLSVLPTPGRMLSPLTMGDEVRRGLAGALNLPQDAPLGVHVSGNDSICAEVLPYLFCTTMHFTLLVGVRTGPTSSSFATEDGMKEYTFTWAHVSDYRDTWEEL